MVLNGIVAAARQFFSDGSPLVSVLLLLLKHDILLVLSPLLFEDGGVQVIKPPTLPTLVTSLGTACLSSFIPRHSRRSPQPSWTISSPHTFSPALAAANPPAIVTNVLLPPTLLFLFWISSAIIYY